MHNLKLYLSARIFTVLDGSCFFAIFVLENNQSMHKSFLLFLISTLFFSFPIFSQETGYASYYSRKLEGHRTSDRGRYHPDSLTCAHRTHPLGTYLKVTNLKNNKRVIVKVTDRGPRPKRLIVDVSYRAAKILDIIRSGTAPVEVLALDSASWLAAINDSARCLASDSIHNDSVLRLIVGNKKQLIHHRRTHIKHRRIKSQHKSIKRKPTNRRH